MAVKSLQTLGALDDATRKAVIAWLKDTRYSGLVTDRKYRLLPRTEDMTATLEALATLAALDQVNAERIQAFIESLYVAENGGFGPRPGVGTAPPSTYQGIVSLVRLGQLPDPLTQKPAATTAKQQPQASDG
jgi:prenyltransferase beta subunit